MCETQLNQQRLFVLCFHLSFDWLLHCVIINGFGRKNRSSTLKAGSQTKSICSLFQSLINASDPFLCHHLFHIALTDRFDHLFNWGKNKESEKNMHFLLNRCGLVPGVKLSPARSFHFHFLLNRCGLVCVKLSPVRSFANGIFCIISSGIFWVAGPTHNIHSLTRKSINIFCILHDFYCIVNIRSGSRWNRFEDWIIFPTLAVKAWMSHWGGRWKEPDAGN